MGQVHIDPSVIRKRGLICSGGIPFVIMPVRVKIDRFPLCFRVCLLQYGIPFFRLRGQIRGHHRKQHRRAHHSCNDLLFFHAFSSRVYSTCTIIPLYYTSSAGILYRIFNAILQFLCNIFTFKSVHGQHGLNSGRGQRTKLPLSFSEFRNAPPQRFSSQRGVSYSLYYTVSSDPAVFYLLLTG